MKSEKARKLVKKILTIIGLPICVFSLIMGIFSWLVNNKSFKANFMINNLLAREWSEDYDYEARRLYDKEEDENYGY